MDTRQWIESPGALAGLLPHWAPPSSNGDNVVVPWPGHNFLYSQPQTQGFIPDSIGASWDFGIQNLLDQSTGVVTAFPPAPYMNYDGHRHPIDSRRSLGRLVSQRPYTNNRRSRSVRNFKPEPSIYFNTYSGHGFSVKDALDKNFKSLVGREDPMLSYGTAVSLRFEFEGYESWTCQVKTRDSRKISSPIPREKLAHEVAKKLVAFLNNRQARPDEEVITPDSVDVKDFFLLRLDHVSKSSWQPHFTIVRDA